MRRRGSTAPPPPRDYEPVLLRIHLHGRLIHTSTDRGSLDSLLRFYDPFQSATRTR